MKFSHYDKLTKSYIFETENGDKIRKSASQVIEQHPEVALKTISNLKKSIDDVCDFIEKGKRAQVGEIREWNGQKMQKQADGSWKPVKESGGESDSKKNTSFKDFDDFQQRAADSGFDYEKFWDEVISPETGRDWEDAKEEWGDDVYAETMAIIGDSWNEVKDKLGKYLEN